MARSRASAVVGRRIRAARERRGLKQADLAAAMGRSPTALSYWESGTRSPGLEDVVELGRVLGIDPAQLLPSQPPKVLARSQAAALAIRDLVPIVDRLVERFEGEAPLPPVPTLRGTNTAEVAGAVRRLAGQEQPPIDLDAVLLAANVRWVAEPMPAALAGLVVQAGNTPVIAVRREDNWRRQRFTTAHELGHILLSHHDTFHVDLNGADGVPADYDWRQERAANEFAAALLMPAQLLQIDLGAAEWPSTRQLAVRYRVSLQAMSIRLNGLGLDVAATSE